MRHGGMDREHHGMRWEQMDTNHDGKITAAENAAFARARFDKMDANHDGVLTKEEMHSRMQAMMQQRMMDRFDKLDANHDGMISKDEMAAGMRRMHEMHGMHRGRMMGGMKDDDDDAMEDASRTPPAH
jgi:Ca2+-binding EF-hand superfamily protein